MPFRFNTLLEEAGIDSAQVRLLRHQPVVAGKPLASVWRSDPETFERYQALQAASQRSSFNRPFWASFIGTWDGRTLFAGLYEVGVPQPIPSGYTSPISAAPLNEGHYDFYPTSRSEHLDEFIGRLHIEWGGGSSGKRAWSQRAEMQNKAISELRLDSEEQPFPGLMDLVVPLSMLGDAPPSWAQPLASSGGVYILTCPRDGSHYIGSAYGAGGFWARWNEYRANGHGGNVALIGREPSDFLVSILEVAGSTATIDDILAAEIRWKRKLQTREFGLNAN